VTFDGSIYRIPEVKDMGVLKLLFGDHVLGTTFIIDPELLLYGIVSLLPVFLLFLLWQLVELPVYHFEGMRLALPRRHIQDVLFVCPVIEYLWLIPLGDCLQGLYVLLPIFFYQLLLPLHLFLVVLHEDLEQFHPLIHLSQLQYSFVNYVREAALYEGEGVGFEEIHIELRPLGRVRDQEFAPDQNVRQRFEGLF
jgi:hypothetical protein